MKRTLALVLTWSFALAAPAATSPTPSRPTARSKPPPPPPPSASRPARDGGRFLFVIDTSSSMKGIAPATRQALFELLYSGIDGYMRDGDTFGLWTFDEEVGTGKFPMQVWSSQKPLECASRAATFVRGQEYRGRNRMDDLMQKLTAVIRAVTNVNVFLITAGEARLEGTPVDEAVNAAFAQRGRERKAARKPFVTTLVAQAGKIVRGTVTLPGEPISLPPRLEPQKRAEKSSTLAATNALTAAPATTPIPDTAAEKTAQSALSSPAEKSPFTDRAESGSETTAPSVARTTTTASSQNTLANEAGPAESAATETPAATPRKVMQIITKPAHKPETEPAKEIADSAETAPLQVAALVATPVTVVTSAPAVAPAPASPTPTAAPPAEPPAASSLPIAITEEQDTAIQPIPKGLVVAAREPAAAAAANAAAPAGMAAMRVDSGLGAIPTLIIGGILLAMSLFLLGIALRRMRPEGQSSLITQSMHRR